EFVSANPTGPLHLGHGRGGIIGDVLANILKFIGHDATKEFYINDAGAQIQKLGKSFKIRCQQATGKNIPMPEDGYQGEYLINLANEAITQNGASFAKEKQEILGDYAKKKMLAQLKTTLQNYGITFDVWFSEKTLHTSGAVDAAFKILDQRGYLFEKDGALWFKSTAFGDDKDRVVRKSSGDLTYVASDIAYMENKVERGFDKMILILGHDHHSYGVRLEGLRKALDLKASLQIILYQLVKMKADGQQVRMSKRAGNIVTLEGVIQEVGTDVARFFYLNRKADAQLEFDLDLALKKTDENPVYYIQYAYVRIGSILQKASLIDAFANITTQDTAPIGQQEEFLIKKIVALKQVLSTISTTYNTHQLTYYLIELANVFHSYYSKNRVIDEENIEKSRARLLLLTQLRIVFELSLDLLGISKPQKM
ncbi:arginine--tRNA ligase, partial [bacterium]|nr:arginine--tRNA ligase [bacterium]